MRRAIIILWLLVPVLLSSQTLEKFSIDNGGASISNESAQLLYTIGEVNVLEISFGNIKASEGFINPDIEIKISPKFFLQGPMLAPIVSGLMNDDLRNSGYIPTISPYLDAVTCNASVFSVTGNNAIVDWVWVELRSAGDNQKLINGKSAFVQRDGDVVSLDGVTPLKMHASQSSYYIVLAHRNHLAAMSSNAVSLSKAPITVDFTNNSFATFGSNAQTTLDSGKKALWAGDVNSNGNIKFSGATNDVNAVKDAILSDPLNVIHFITFSSFGYLDEDVDMNGIGRFSGSINDSNIIKDNILSHPLNVVHLPTFTISGTVPIFN